MNRLLSMEIFAAVVESNSLSRASHALHMAPSTISFHIANLESYLGTTILNRTTRTLTITDEGKKYYELCKRVLADIKDVESSLGKSKSTATGRLRIDTNDEVVSRLLQPVMAQFLRRYPGVSLDFVFSGHNFDASQIGADVMIRMPLKPFDESRVVASPIGYSHAVVAASPSYLERHGEPATPMDLLNHRCIGSLDSWSGRHWEWFFEENGKRLAVDVPCRLGYSIGEHRVDAAIRGLGIVNDLMCFLREPLLAGKLKLILQQWSWTPPPYHILYPENLRRSRKVKAFVNFILEKYPPNRELQPPLNDLR